MFSIAVLNRHKELLELQVSVECETFSASQLEELLDSSSVEIEILLKAKINALPEDVRYLAIVTVIGVRYVCLLFSSFKYYCLELEVQISVSH